MAADFGHGIKTAILYHLLALLLGLGFLSTALAAPPTVVVVPSQPKWSELTTAQQTVLKPLAQDWDQMENYRRQKWLVIANRWPTMDREARNRAWDRMREWARLSPENRRLARERYKALQNLPPERRAELKKQWEAYAQLPEEEKRKYQAQAAKKQLGSAPGVAAKSRTTTPPQAKPAANKQAQSATLAPPSR